MVKAHPKLPQAAMEEQQLKAHKTNMQSLEAMGYDTSDRAHATELACEYGTKLYTCALYRNPNPQPTYDHDVTERHKALKPQAVPQHEILNRFKPTN